MVELFGPSITPVFAGLAPFFRYEDPFEELQFLSPPTAYLAMMFLVFSDNRGLSPLEANRAAEQLLLGDTLVLVFMGVIGVRFSGGGTEVDAETFFLV